MQAALLLDRGVVKVVGDDARAFLGRLITADIDKVTLSAPAYAALLTPQGKIIVDFIVVENDAAHGGGFFLDVPRALALDLVARLNLYKLRAKVIVEDLSQVLGVMALWGDGARERRYGLAYPDPRLPALGTRIMLPPHQAAEAATSLGAVFDEPIAYEMHRIALAIPAGGLDFAYGDAFPHEADMDQLGGVDFEKGCYVGQEVVSRMEHRGTARNRVVAVRYADAAPMNGATVTAGEKTIGVMGSATNGRGLALLRLDRVAEAQAAGTPITAGGIALAPEKPGWARFAWPGATVSA